MRLRLQASFWGDYGAALAADRKPAEAYELIKRSVEAFERKNDIAGLATNYSNFTMVCALLGKVDEAERYHNLAVKYELMLGTAGLHEVDKKNRELIETVRNLVETRRK